MEKLTPEILLNAYANGYFPMADSRDSTELGWYHPELRGIIPLDGFHTPKSLAKALAKHPFEMTVDKAFREVITACATRAETWINNEIIDLYCTLHEMGFAHSVEVWRRPSLRAERNNPAFDRLDRHVALSAPRDDEILVGGLYGVTLGSAFFGESMFSNETGASKAALVHLVTLLKEKGYTLLDTQYVNDHLKQFGVIEIPRAEYMERLQKSLQVKAKNLT